MHHRVAVFIDGMYLRLRLREQKWVEFIDVLYFAQRLAGRRELEICDYFVGEPSEAHLGTLRYRDEEAYYKKVRNSPLIEVHFGKFEKRESTASATWGEVRIRRWIEKKVDVLFAVQMLARAYADAFDTAYILSGDADLVPVVKTVRGMGKRVRPCIFLKPRGVSWSNWEKSHELWRESDLPHTIRNWNAVFRPMP